MYYSFKSQQVRFRTVFQSFEILFSYRCDAYRCEEFRDIINREPVEFLATMFCDSLLNSALYTYSNERLYRVLKRRHFTFCYDVFEPSSNITNKHPQFFFSLWGRKPNKKKVYEIVFNYFMYHMSELEEVLGRREALRIIQNIGNDEDLRFVFLNINKAFYEAYSEAILDVVCEFSKQAKIA